MSGFRWESVPTLDRVFVYNWFAGKTLPSLDHMVSLSYLLKKSLDELVCSTGVRIWEAPEPDETRWKDCEGMGILLDGSMGSGRDVRGFPVDRARDTGLPVEK